MELKTRLAQLSDLPYIYDICLKTGLSGKDASGFVSDPYIIGQHFAAPYLHFEPDQCMVLTNNRIPLGYIVGTSNTDKFYRWMNMEWLPAIRLIYPKSIPAASDFEAFILKVIHEDCRYLKLFDTYPAHLHINLLPEVQGGGMGKKLMNEFIAQLKTKDIHGLHLSVGKKNKNAIKFYEKTGFSLLKTYPKAFTMGIRFY